MPWVRGALRGKDVWVEVDDGGDPVVKGGRVPIRYSEAAGAKLYAASPGNLTVFAGKGKALPEGPAAEAAPKAAGRGSGFGSAGSRTTAQAAAAKVAAGSLVASFPPEAIVCFTDGACKGNPGPTGAGAVVRLPDGRRIERHLALGRGTNNIGELSAIGLALDILDEEALPLTARVELLTDSQYSIGVLQQGWKAKANTELVAGLRQRLRARRATLHWVAGHSGVADNERADALANRGVDESRRGLR